MLLWLFGHVLLLILFEKEVEDIDLAVAPKEERSVVEVLLETRLSVAQKPIANWCSLD